MCDCSQGRVTREAECVEELEMYGIPDGIS